jgi:superfamily II DNA or RNA helicase
MSMLEIPNPRWLENQRLGRWNLNVPKTLRFYEQGENSDLIIPRGLIRQVLVLCRKHDITIDFKDERRRLDPIDISFEGSLKSFQDHAVNAVSKKEFATLSAPTGSGKTVIGLALIAIRKQPTLIVVHTKELAMQWVRQIETFFRLPQKEIGIIGAGHKKIGDKLTVGLVQSLYKSHLPIHQQTGFLLVDECHRIPSRTFTDVVSRFDARYMLGLSATPWRRDGLSKLIFWYLGNLHWKIDKTDLEKSGELLKPEVIFRKTQFRTNKDPARYYGRIILDLVNNDERNRMIAKDVASEAQSRSGTILVLTDRRHHCDTLQALLRFRHNLIAECLTGDLAYTQRKAIVERLNNQKITVLIATGQLIGEGFDCKNLSSLFLTTPIKYSGRLIQYLGRILRPAPGKSTARVFDYVDEQVGVLKAAAEARKKTYYS